MIQTDDIIPQLGRKENRCSISWYVSRVKGIGEEYADLLEVAGVDTVPELAQRNPANLYQKLVEINEARNVVRRPPTQAQVETWVEQAKTLPRVITY